MFIRQAVRRVAVVVASVSAASAFSIAMMAGPAGAAPPTSGSIVPNSAVPIDTNFTAGTPFSSGQNINVVVPANSVFTSTTQDINVLECSAPNGVIPTSPSACDGNTINGPTLTANGDGSIDFQASTGSGYPVYALPDTHLFETPSGVPCGNTAATECILYIGVQQSDFTQPHVWSQPFFITANADDLGGNPGDGSANPGNGLPEVPFAILLPIAAMGAIGGTVLIRRRRLSRVSSDA
jgi:hypothetical protein